MERGLNSNPRSQTAGSFLKWIFIGKRQVPFEGAAVLRVNEHAEPAILANGSGFRRDGNISRDFHGGKGGTNKLPFSSAVVHPGNAEFVGIIGDDLACSGKRAGRGI